jgi:hypothetical protein
MFPKTFTALFAVLNRVIEHAFQPIKNVLMYRVAQKKVYAFDLV